MNKPIPINHMMAWGAITGAIAFVSYAVLFGTFNFAELTQWLLVLIAGGFGGYTLGALSGMLLGFTLAGHSESITRDALYNRQLPAYIVVFMSVFLVGLGLLFAIPEFVAHPLILSLVGAVTALGATRHYLYRMEQYLKHEKPKRKEERTVDHSRLEVTDREDISEPTNGQQSGRLRKS